MYSPDHRGYICPHLTLGSRYISRDVQFFEDQFPFTTPPDPTPSSRPPCPSISSLIPGPSYPSNPLSSTYQPYSPSPPTIPLPISPLTQSNNLPNPDSLSSSPNSRSSSPSLHTQSSLPTPTSLESSPSPILSTAPHVLPLPTLVPEPTHPMVTRSKSNIQCPRIHFDGTIPWKNPKPTLSLTISSSLSSNPSLPIPVELTSFTEASNYPNWRSAMHLEFQALLQNHTWDLVPFSPNYNVLGSKWILKTKCRDNGSLERRMARLEAKGFHKKPSLD